MPAMLKVGVADEERLGNQLMIWWKGKGRHCPGRRTVNADAGRAGRQRAEIAGAASVGPESGLQVARLDRAAEFGQAVGLYAHLERPRVLPAATERLRETIA